MSTHLQWIPLSDPINAYMDESEQSNHKEFKLTHLAFRAMDELGLDAFYTVRSVKLQVNGNLTVTLPANCLKVTKVGVFNEQGCVIPLSNNNNLSTAYDLQPTRLSQTQDPSLLTIEQNNGLGFYNYWDGYTFGNLYGIPSGAPFVGSYKIDNGNGVVVLNESFCYDYIVLEFVPSPDECGGYFIPIQFREAVISYLRWKDIISMPSSRKGNLGDKRDRRHEFFNDRRLAIARYDPIVLPDLYQWNLESQRMVVKA